MTTEKLEYAILMQLVEGDVVQRRKPTLNDIGKWTEVGKAHAVANTLVALLYIREAYGLLDSPHDDEQKMFDRLRELGWDGKTDKDFMTDVEGIKDSLREVLSTSDYNIYFGESSLE